MNISAINSISFNAKIDISNVEKYRYYWQEVADNFSKKTADKDATLKLSEHFLGMVDFAVKYPNKNLPNSTVGFIACSKEVFDKLTNETPQKVADKLSTAFEYFNDAVEERENALFTKISNFAIKGHVSIHKAFKDINKNMIGTRDKIMTNVNYKLDNNKDLNGFQILI